MISPLISSSQVGFRKGKSTLTNLYEFFKNGSLDFREHKYTDVISTDFSKAFDKVNLSTLVQKANLLCFQPSTHRVIFDDILSDTINVSSGVPQGGNFGPILFLLFNNDISSAIEYSTIFLHRSRRRKAY